MADTTLGISGTPNAGEVGIAYSYSPSLENASSSATVALTGTLPDGLSVSQSTGAVTGTPTKAGSFSFTLTVTDGDNTAKQDLSVSVADAVTLNPISDQNVATGAQISFSASADNGVTPYTFSLSGDPLPSGITFDAGTFSGTAGSEGTLNITVTVTDKLGGVAKSSFALVTTDALAISGIPSTWYVQGSPMLFEPTTSGSSATLSYSVSGDLPTGLNINPNSGAISGTPTTTGVASFVIVVSDGSAKRRLPVGFEILAPLTITGTTGPAEVGISYTANYTLSGGYGSVSLVEKSGTLPDGLSAQLTGTLFTVSGTPTASGSFTAIYTLTDQTGSYDVTIAISVAGALTIDITEAPAGIVTGQLISYKPVVTGGYAKVALAASGSLPPGITFDSTNQQFVGSTTQPGEYAITLTASDALGSTSVQYTLVVSLTLSGVYSPINGAVNVPCTSNPPTISGGYGTKSFSVVDENAMPIGLAIDAVSGVVSGVAALAANTTVQVVVSDSSGTAIIPLEINIESSLDINGALGVVVIGVPMSFTPTVNGGNAQNYAFSLSGNLPPEYGFNKLTGQITGTPAAKVTLLELVITVTDGVQTAKLTLGLTTTNPLTAPDPQTFNAVYQSMSSYQIQADNSATAIYALSAGTLPNGLRLNPNTGVISGIPLETGSSTCTIRIAGSANAAVTHVNINIQGQILISAAPPTGNIQQAYSYTPAVTGGFAPKTFSLNEINPMPSGLSFDPNTGTISGVPQEVATRSLSITVTDGVSSVTSTPFALTILANGISGTPSVANDDVFIATQCAAYVSIMSKPFLTGANYASAIKIMSTITNALIAYPTPTALTTLYNLHVKYANSYFLESNFFRGCNALTNQNLTKLSVVYSAFRAAIATPTIPYNYSYVSTTTGRVEIANFLAAKQRLNANPK